MRRIVALALGLGACSDTTQNATTQLNLDRPIDVAFACYGGLRITNGGGADPSQPVAVTAQPLQSCDVRSGPHDSGTPVPVPSGQEDLTGNGGTGVPIVGWYSLILQSGPGTVALASWDTKPSSAFAGGDILMLDANALTPGKNGIAIGEDPVGIVTDKVGCYAITANAGSCDLSELDINSALDDTPDVRVDRFEVKNAAGVAIHARPAAIVAEPAAGTIGVACPMQGSGLVYVAYPSCHLVAAIDAATGIVQAGITFDAMGLPTITDGNVTCPDECGGQPITAGTRPVALDLELDPTQGQSRRLAIGSDNSNVLTVVELGFDYMPMSTLKVPLQNTTGKLGVTHVALSPQIGMGGSSGDINDDSSLAGIFQFVYAVANDQTVRVADIYDVRKECDTQVDPRYLHDLTGSLAVKQVSCMPVGDPATPPRRPGARGPGIELTGDAIPTSVEVFKIPALGTSDTRAPGTPSRMIGYFGVITASNGRAYVLNVDNDDWPDLVVPTSPIGTGIPLDIAHQLRDALPDREAVAEENVDGVQEPICNTFGPDPDSTAGNSAGPRTTAAPTRNLPAGVVAAEKVGELPSIRQVKCTGHDDTMPVSELQFSAPITVRDQEFPDLRGLAADENWTLTWEGSLSLDKASSDIDGPGVRESQIVVDAAGMHLLDQTKPYCDAGVEPFDTVQLRGCDPTNGDGDCPLGYTCYVHPQSQVTGLGACMLKDEADRLANACKEFLTSLRRYTVGKTTSGELTLLPRKKVLRTTPLDGCTSDQQCLDLATYALQLGGSANPVDDTTAPDIHTWTCAVDPDRKPLLDAMGVPDPTRKRCIETCTDDTSCVTGTVCDLGTHMCMEGVIPPQACINAPQRYELRAAEAFTVIGSPSVSSLASGYVHPIIADPSGNCIRDPNASRLQIGRIPLRAPACDPNANPLTGKRMDGTFEPNPCETTVTETEYQNNYVAGTCTVGTPAVNLVDRQADAIKFRNRGMTLTIVDPTYPGDAMCIGDRQGTLGSVPVVASGAQTTFRQTAGFTPFVLGITPSLPVKVTRGPLESIWVVDEGDFLSTSITTPSTRGKVFRIESQSLVINALE